MDVERLHLSESRNIKNTSVMAVLKHGIVTFIFSCLEIRLVVVWEYKLSGFK